MFLPCGYGRKSTAESECSQRIPAPWGVSSISSICSAIEKYKPSIFQKHIQTDIKYFIIYVCMYYHAATYLKAADIYPTANADPDPQYRPIP